MTQLYELREWLKYQAKEAEKSDFFGIHYLKFAIYTSVLNKVNEMIAIEVFASLTAAGY